VELFRAEPARLARHLHIPLQSGSDEVLEAMRRNYRTDLYREVVERLVAEVPGIGVGADLLTGFPSETERHHEETMAFLESLPIAFVHAFSYSTREGTEAASMKPLSGEIVSRRNEELRELGERKSKAFIEGQCGAPLRALTLGATRDNLACAMTGNYIQVVLPGEPVVPNCWVTVTPDRHESDNAAVGRIVSDCEPRY